MNKKMRGNQPVRRLTHEQWEDERVRELIYKGSYIFLLFSFIKIFNLN